jgi:protein-S-isoprenylcysteine O-methyltransferase Ste14
VLRHARSSPAQTFVVFPVVVLAADIVRRRHPRIRLPWLAVMAAGYLLYRAAGGYRHARAGGRGFASTPHALVIDGPYALTRNPMYAGHLVFLAGLIGATRSPLAVALFLRQLARFRSRISRDEERLEALFGDGYRAYRARVPRWAFVPDDPAH